jgi:hypothetical protein
MMTPKEDYQAATNWLQKVLVMNLYHQVMQCSVRATADYFNVSAGLVSENLNIARNHALIKHAGSRGFALKLIKERKRNDTT